MFNRDYHVVFRCFRELRLWQFNVIRQCQIVGVLLMSVVVLLASGVMVYGQSTERGQDNRETNSQVSSVEDAKVDDSGDPEQKQFKLALLVTIVVVIVFFVAILLLAIVRIARHRHNRLRLGQKNPPTEYIDAWSQHKIDEDDLDYTQ